MNNDGYCWFGTVFVLIRAGRVLKLVALLFSAVVLSFNPRMFEIMSQDPEADLKVESIT